MASLSDKQTFELSRVVSLQSVREHRRFTAQVTASPEECVALAKRYQITAVNNVQADVVLKTMGPDLVRFTGVIKAQIVQPCGVSLEPVTQDIAEEHDELLTTSADLLVPIDDMVPDANSPTELIEGDSIDYGEIVAQIIALAIDPFPRKDEYATVSHVEHSNNPFDALKTLKQSDKGSPANDED
jgi:uncharacterized metal-binding protein YceD (DUF177 family)